jgi:SOS response regulatory protein OraA/RecX
VERSDGRLATVSYLFGAPVNTETEQTDQAPSERDNDAADVADTTVPVGESAGRDASARDSVTGKAAVGEAAIGEPAVGDTAGPAANGRTQASGWYIEPGGLDEASSRDDEPVEEEPEPEAAAIAAARRFLSLVESGSAGKAETPGGLATAETTDETTRRRSAPGVRFTEEPEVETPKPPAVRKASINALARKGMSSAEMVTLLENREIEPEEVAAEVERLERAGLLDDRVLAEDLVRTLRDRKGLGKSAITAELRRRRVDQTAIEEALESVDVDDELERATEVAVKRAGQLSSYDRATAERRLSAFLQRRGYSGSVVGAAVNAALGPAGPRFR